MSGGFLYLSMLTLGLLVAIHEAGHLLMARRCGVLAEEVSIGFGPAIATFNGRRPAPDPQAAAGTPAPEPVKYRLRLIPLGGYVKFRGMEEDPAEAVAPGLGGSGSPAESSTETPGDSAPDPYSYREKSVGRRMAIIAAGPAANAAAAVILLTGVYMAGIPQSANDLQAVKESSPAAEAGLSAGDRITSVGGSPTESWSAVERELADARAGEKVAVTYESAGTGNNPEAQAQGEAGGSGERGMLAIPGDAGSSSIERLAGGGAAAGVGLEPSTFTEGSPVHEALGQAIVSCVVVTALMAVVVIGLILGTFGLGETLIGPVGMVSLTGDAPGMATFVFLMAVISLDLAIFNLLPIPPLDGGHLAFSAIEKLRGRPVSPKVAALATNFGIALMVTTIIFVTFSDISKLLRGIPILGGFG